MEKFLLVFAGLFGVLFLARKVDRKNKGGSSRSAGTAARGGDYLSSDDSFFDTVRDVVDDVASTVRDYVVDSDGGRGVSGGARDSADGLAGAGGSDGVVTDYVYDPK